MNLRDAILAGNLDRVRELIAGQADVGSPFADGQTPIQLAAREKHLDIVRVLAEAGADPRDLAELDFPDRLDLFVRSTREDQPEDQDMMSTGDLVEWLFEMTNEELTEAIAADVAEDQSPLFLAIRLGDVKAVQERIAAGDDLNEIRDIEEDTPLVSAVDLGRGEIVRELLAAGADVNLDGGWGTPLLFALPDLRLAKLLIDAGADVDQRGQDGRVPIEVPAKDADLVLARLLLEAGANPLVAEEGGECFLLQEVGQEKEWEIYQELLPHYPEQDVLETAELLESFQQSDPRSMAVAASLELIVETELGELGRVRELLAEGEAEIACPELGSSPLMKAAERPHLEIMRTLIAAGADVDEVCPQPILWLEGSTPLACAAAAYDGSKAADAVRLLLDEGASVNLRGACGRTALMHAAVAAHRREGSREAFALLLAAGADPDLEDEFGHTAWTLAQYPLVEEEERVRAPRKKKKRDDLAWLRPSKKERREQLERCHEVAELLEQAGAVPRRLPELSLLGAVGPGNDRRVKELLEAGANPDARDPEGEPAVVVAAQEGWGKVVAHLIRAGCDVNATRPRFSTTALEAAVRASDLGLVRQLLDAGADPALLPPMPPGESHSPLAQAEAKGNHELVELMRGLVPPPPDDEEEDETPPETTVEDEARERLRALVRAAADGHLEAVRELLAAGVAEIDGLDAYGRTALAAAAEGGHHEVIRELVAAGADVNRGNAVEASPRSTPLICAAISPSAQRDRTLRLLLEAGAELDLRGADGRTALMHAVERDVGFFGRTGEVALSTRTLIAAGAALEVRDPYGLTAWMRAMSLAASINVAEIAEQYRAIARLLAEAGASIEGACDVELVSAAAGPLPLSRRGALGFPFRSRRKEAAARDAERVGELLGQGASPDARRHDGTPALILAVRSGRPEIVKALVRAGCDLNARERLDRGATALIQAVQSGHYELVRILLAAGADPTVRLHPERRRTSPRALAVSGGHHRIAGLLGEPKRRFRRPFSGLMIPGG